MEDLDSAAVARGAWMTFNQYRHDSEAQEQMSYRSLADALRHAVAEGYCDGDPTDVVLTTGDRELDRRRLMARRLFKVLSRTEATNDDEAHYVADALVLAPPEWRARRLSDRSIRNALAAAEFSRYGEVSL